MKATWVFDVDGCLIDSLTGTSLRPGGRALLEALKDRRCSVLVWSAGGATYARRRAEAHGIDDLVDGFHAKRGRDAAGRYLVSFVDPARSVVFVDDRPEDLPAGATVVAVSPYLAPDPHDNGFVRAGLGSDGARPGA